MGGRSGKTRRASDEAFERRDFTATITLRDDGDDADGTVTGIASVFETETVIGGLYGWREKIAPSAFDGALSRPDDVRALFNHDENIVLGRTTNQTLRLRATEDGLRYEIDLPNTSQAADVRELIKRGDVSGSSFGFKVLDDEWDESDTKNGKLPLRTITDVELWDVSPVTYPAYPTTSVSARSKSDAIGEALERWKAAQVEAREAARQAITAARAVEV